MVFCLDIKVSEDSKITMNLCNNCYRKILSFYKFKALSLKNDAYLKSLDPVMQLEGQKLSVYVDEDGIKHENFSDSDEFGPSLMEDCDTEFKIEVDVEECADIEINVKKEDELQGLESDEEPLSKVQKVKYENIKYDSKRNATVKKKLGRPKKLQSEKTKAEQQVCEECGKSVRNLKAHSVLHQQKGERPVFHCKLCPKFFATESGHNKHHKSVHLGTSRSPKTKSICDICNKEVKHLDNHKQMMHNQETLPYGCVSCERRFFTTSALKKHMTKHVGIFDRPYKCDICQKRYLFKNQVSNHIRKSHQNEKNYQCDICSRTFFDKQPFIYHLESHSDKPLYKCNKCGLALKTQVTLWSHHKTVHRGVTTFHCTLCTKSFKRSWSLKTHMFTHTKERPFQCQFCDMRLRRSHHLKRHELAHKKHTLRVNQDSKITTNLCSNCFRKIVLIYKFKALSLKNDSYLKSLNPIVQLEDQKVSVYVDENKIKHENYLESGQFGPGLVENINLEIKVEVREKDNTFEDDHIDVKNEDMLQYAESDEEPLTVIQKVKCDDVKENAPVYKKRDHSKKIKLPKQRKIKQEQQVCEECGKSVRNLKEHSFQHQSRDQQAVKCEACPKYFVTRLRQRRHYKYAHASSLKSKCDICNKEVRDVKTHKKMIHHRATLPYGCVSCERRYLFRSALEAHMTTHTNELPYECDVCHKRFRSKSQISNHIREMHLQEKNFQCEFCSKTFYGKSSFEQHSRTHVKERLYKCEECGLALKTMETLKKHRTVHSGVKRFHCTLCTKTFRLSGSLKSHMLTHTKEKPWQCQFCDARFRRSHHLKRHELSLHTKLDKAE